MSRFDDVMKHLHPKVLIAKIEVPHDTARGQYLLKSSVVKSHQEFELELISYVKHHMAVIGPAGSTIYPELALSRAKSFLEAEMGFDTAVYCALSGTMGGMQGILDRVCDGFKKEQKQAYFQYIIDKYVDPLNIHEIIELMRELKSRLMNFSPQPFQFIPVEQMALSYKQVVYAYIDTLIRYKNLWVY
ncbi:MAG: hypothetical protein AB1611_15615 [bacterium]